MRVAVIGTGYVGLTTGVCLAALGHQVTCVDIMPERVAAINRREIPFYEPGLAEKLATTLASHRLRVTGSMEAVADSHITFITVGTPQSEQGIDLSGVHRAARDIGSVLRGGSGYPVVVVKSTVVPGTTDTLVRKALEEASGRRAGEFGLCMNPEFLREGCAVSDFMAPDRIVIGQWDKRSGQALAEVYRSLDCPRIFTSLRNAEVIKYAANALLATLISFSNEMAALCEATDGADIAVVMEGLHLDRRLSPVVNGQRISPGILNFLLAGCGFGGSCLPKDVNALRAYARERGLTPELLDAVAAVNINRPKHIVKLAEGALGPLKSTVIAVLGLAFKPGTDDIRDSPALPVVRLLSSQGATVRIYDPMVKRLPDNLSGESPVNLCATAGEALDDADAAIVVTAWPEFAGCDWTGLCAGMRRQVVIDGRNALRDVAWPEGVRYISIGRAAESQRPPESTQ